MDDLRKIGYYKVCHPYSMSESTIGYWDGKWWSFEDIPNGKFEDDDLQWIGVEKLTKNG